MILDIIWIAIMGILCFLSCYRAYRYVLKGTYAQYVIEYIDRELDRISTTGQYPHDGSDYLLTIDGVLHGKITHRELMDGMDVHEKSRKRARLTYFFVLLLVVARYLR